MAPDSSACSHSGTSKFFHGDYLNSITRETDSSQATTATKQCDAFGMPLSSTGSSASPFGFAGCFGYQEDGDSGLKLLGHRYYDPSTGRFLTRDAAKDGRNWYGYCENQATTPFEPNARLGLQSTPSPTIDHRSRHGSTGADVRATGLNCPPRAPAG